jgi:putative tryptophan/tyrosine transport system substrate-binding protein
MKKNVMRLTLCAMLLALGNSASAQQAKKVPRIGWIWYGAVPSGSFPSVETAIIDGLRELGYVDGKTINIEYRAAEGHPEKIAELANDLVRQNVDLILGIGGDIASIVSKATLTIPIVVGTSDDPVRSSMIASLARPGGNLTGVTFIMDQLAGKRVELLKEISPKLTRLAVLWNPAHVDAELKEIETVSHALGIKLTSHQAQRREDVDQTFAAVAKENPQAMIVVPSRLMSLLREPIANFAKKLRVPMVSGWREFAEAGGLASYGPNRVESARRIAYFVDRILKGTKPADLPVEQPTKFEFVINLKTAKQIGLTIPPNVLVRADRVIR